MSQESGLRVFFFVVRGVVKVKQSADGQSGEEELSLGGDILKMLVETVHLTQPARPPGLRLQRCQRC